MAIRAKVKFGLARYSENAGDDNGGYVVVPPDLNNKATILSTLATLPASGNTPLSETLVDVGRYLAGADRISPYPAYARDLTGGSLGPIPPSPVTSSCEKLFVIAVTDGLPTADNNDHYPGPPRTSPARSAPTPTPTTRATSSRWRRACTRRTCAARSRASRT